MVFRLLADHGKRVTGPQLVLQFVGHDGAAKSGTQDDDVSHKLYSLFAGRAPEVSSAALAARLMGKLTSPSQAAMKAEMKLRIQDALSAMEPLDREVLTLRHFEQLSNRETAQLLEISETAACNRYVRALKRLKTLLQEMAGDEGEMV